MTQTWGNIIDPVLFIPVADDAVYNSNYRRRYDDRNCMSMEELQEIKEEGCEQVVKMYYSMMISDEENDYRHSFAEKRRIDLDEILTELLSDAWKEIAEKPFCVKRHNMLHLVVLYCELWGFVNKVNAREHEEIGGYLSEDVIEVFDKHIVAFQKQVLEPDVKLDDYLAILDIRDKIVEFLQNVYRVRYPSSLGQNIEAPMKEYEESRYRVFDLDWLNNKIGDRKTEVAFSSIIRSRINQMYICCDRLDIYRTAHHPDIPGFPDLVGAPIRPNRTYIKKNCSEVNDVMLGQFMTMHDALRERDPNNYCLNAINEEANYWTCRYYIRRKQQDYLNKMLALESESKEHIGMEQVLAALSVSEAALLILLKAFAPFVDQSYGIYGQFFPDTVSAQLWEAYQIEPTQKFPDEKLTVILDEIRENARLSLKKYYISREHNLEKIMKKQIKRNDMATVDEALNNVIPQMKPFFHQLNWNQRIEKFERRRLEKQREMAEDIKTCSLLPTVPKFSITLKEKWFMVFYCNYNDILTENRAMRMPPQSYPKWKELKVQYDDWPKKTVEVIRSEVARFLIASVKIQRADVKCAIASSLFACLVDHIFIHEVQFGRIMEVTRARERLQVVLEVLTPLCNVVLKSDRHTLKGDYKEMEQRFVHRHICRLDYQKHDPTKLLKPVNIPENEYREIVKEFITCIEVYSHFLSVKI